MPLAEAGARPSPSSCFADTGLAGWRGAMAPLPWRRPALPRPRPAAARATMGTDPSTGTGSSLRPSRATRRDGAAPRAPTPAPVPGLLQRPSRLTRRDGAAARLESEPAPDRLAVAPAREARAARRHPAEPHEQGPARLQVGGGPMRPQQTPGARARGPRLWPGQGASPATSTSPPRPGTSKLQPAQAPVPFGIPIFRCSLVLRLAHQPCWPGQIIGPQEQSALGPPRSGQQL